MNIDTIKPTDHCTHIPYKPKNGLKDPYPIHIKFTAWYQVMFWFIFSFIWTGFSLFLSYFCTLEVLNGNYYATIGYGVTIIGLIFIGVAIRSFLRWKKFGNSYLYIREPFVGAVLEGKIVSSVLITTPNPFVLTLKCNRNHKDRGQKSHYSCEWEKKETAAGYITDMNTTMIPIRFAIPSNALPSSRIGASRDCISWQLEITTSLKGANYYATFSITVNSSS